MNAKKSLGQNFLRNQYLAEQIVALADLQSDDRVLEIGPGQGILTDIIAEEISLDGLFLAVEKDWKLAEDLKKKYKNRKNVKIICADVLEIADELVETLGNEYKLVSNLPYNITNLILNKFYFQKSEIRNPNIETNSNDQTPNVRNKVLNLENSNLDIVSNFDIRYSNLTPRVAVLMVQREVAERLTAPPGEKARGIPTVLLENVAETKIMINHIKPGAFSPAPAVESSVLKIIRKEKIGELNPVVVKAGFSAKRQKLINSLSRGLKMPKAKISAIMKETEINPDLRAEELTINQWRLISVSISKLKSKM